MIRKILVPVDFSEGSRAGLRKACELARAISADLLVLYADEFPIMPVGESAYLPPYVVEEHAASVERQLADVVAEAKQQGVVAACGRVVLGPAHTTILDVAAREGADLIVMGTHGRRGFRHLVIGSVAERIARTTKIPVMTVRNVPAHSPSS